MGEAGFKPNTALWGGGGGDWGIFSGKTQRGGGGGGGGEILGYFREKHNVESAYLQV